jgi:endonuclease/exonuclease/phosphatase family metal-dependent hydrolase
VSGARDERPPALRVATFNVRNGIAFDGLDSWPLRRHTTAQAVAGLDADLIALQEVYGFQQRYLLRHTRGYAATGAGRADGLRRGERCTVLYRGARLDLAGATTRWFSDTPDLPGSTGWGNRLPRIVTLARFSDLATGRAFGFADCHLEGSPAAARHRSAAALVAWLDPALPWIVAGDLNAEPHDQAVRTLLGAGLRDVFALGSATPGPPAQRYDEAAPAAPATTLPRGGERPRRIDYLFVTREWQVGAGGGGGGGGPGGGARGAPGRRAAAAGRAGGAAGAAPPPPPPPPPPPASDHLPVVATLRLLDLH